MALYAMGWCVWDLPALCVLLALGAVFALHCHRLQKRERKLEEELTRRSAQSVVQDIFDGN